MTTKCRPTTAWPPHVSDVFDSLWCRLERKVVYSIHRYSLSENFEVIGEGWLLELVGKI